MPAWWIPVAVKGIAAIVQRVRERRRRKQMDKILKAIFVSWKTSVLGLVVAILQAKASGMTWGAILMALPTLLLGLVAKDGDKSGTDPK